MVKDKKAEALTSQKHEKMLALAKEMGLKLPTEKPDPNAEPVSGS